MISGGGGRLRQSLVSLGYRYVNLDISAFSNSEPSVVGDAHALPFSDGQFDLVISKDTLEHFMEPWAVVRNVHRVLKAGGQFIIWVPFIHPFHEDDFYRYTPLGLRYLLRDFEIVLLDSPLWVFTAVRSIAITGLLRRFRLGFAVQIMRWLCGWLDRRLIRYQRCPSASAAAYRVVARKEAGGVTHQPSWADLAPGTEALRTASQ